MPLPLSPCGIDCSTCIAYIATQTDDTATKQKMAEDYKAKFKLEKTLAELECDGCNQTGRHIGFCAECSIRQCSTAQGYATCAECADFPCEKGEFIWTTNSQSKARLEELRV